jgi:hypothetical protein
MLRSSNIPVFLLTQYGRNRTLECLSDLMEISHLNERKMDELICYYSL